jgi:predicted alpha/beta-fold hydrolase
VSLNGHYWTIAPRFRHALRPSPAPPARPWKTRVPDPDFGSVEITGLLREKPGADSVLIVIHGLGGSCESNYALRAASAAEAAGLSCLRMNLRGADRSGEDLYHAGLTDDLRAALRSPEIRKYRRALVLGYSLGGHVALRYAAEYPGDGVAAVAAVSSPLNLEVCQANLDAPASWLYRTYLLSALKSTYRAVAARRLLPNPPEAIQAISRLREFDELAVAPRHHFAGAEDYYARASVWPLLPRLEVPALLVASRNDPMVPLASVEPWVGQASPALTVRWEDSGGHVGFPPDLDLGEPSPRGLEPQVLHWLVTR